MELMDAQIGQGFRRSLSVIHTAKSQYDSYSAGAATMDALVSQIGVCDVLLREIHTIRAGLEKQRTISRTLQHATFNNSIDGEDFGRSSTNSADARRGTVL